MVDEQQTDSSVDEASQTSDVLSKTQLKVQAKALQDVALQLVKLSKEKLTRLSLGETTLKAINDYALQKGHIAKKRHIAYIAKCFRKEDIDLVKQELEQDNFKQHRFQAQQSKVIASPLENLIDSLVNQGNEKLNLLIDKNPQIERQVLRQLIRNTQAAKTIDKKQKYIKKLYEFLSDNNVSDYD